MLTAEELCSMRACVATALPDRAVILTAPRVTGQAGGWSDDWANATESLPLECLLLEVATPGEKVEGGKKVSEVRWIVSLPLGTVVNANQRLRVNGIVFQILTVSPSQAWSMSVDCGCKTLQ